MIITRCEMWPEAFAQLLEERRAAPFAWGEHDCCLFACDVALVMTGVDLAEGFRGGYRDRRGARRVMREFAGGGVLQLAQKVARDHGIEEWLTPLAARRGDIVLTKPVPSLGSALGVVDLSGYELVIPGPEGLVRVPSECAACAWRIG